jgi:hypothetical protein
VLVGEIDWEGADAQALLEPLLATPARRKAAYDLSNDCIAT